MKYKILILALVLCLAAVVIALANGSLALPRQVLGGGGTESAAGDVVLRGTLGQPVIGSVSGGDVALGQGFWHGGGYDVHVPLVLKQGGPR